MSNKNKYKRFSRKYDKHFPDEIPSVHAGIDDIPSLREMQKYKRSFPLWGYRWKKAAAATAAKKK